MEYRQAISIAIDTLDCLATSVAGNENKGVTVFAEVAKTLGDSVRRIDHMTEAIRYASRDFPTSQDAELAKIHALLAQAEQTKRLADLLESIISDSRQLRYDLADALSRPNADASALEYCTTKGIWNV